MNDKPKILLVDDRPQNLISLAALLETESAEIVSTQSGNEALAALLDHEFALVLMDVQMPGMDGFEAAELMRANSRTKDIPIIFLTAISTEQRFVFKGYESGAIDYIAKPIDAFILRSKVRLFLGIWERKAALEGALAMNRMLMREIHHRVKNNLAVVSSIIGLQESFVFDRRDVPILEDIRSRINTIVLVYEMIHQTGEMSDLNMKYYLKELLNGIMIVAARPDDPIHQETKFSDITLPVEAAINVGLILNELVTNAIKHAFPEGRQGTVTVGFDHYGGGYALTVQDDGVGITKPVDLSTVNSLGLRLVDVLTSNLSGSAERLDQSPGTGYRVCFPVPDPGHKK